MQQLKHNHNMILAPLLALVMLATRGHHDLSPVHLPDASWAVFFLLGLYLPQRWLFTLFFLLAAGMDYISITWGGVSSFCVTGAYLLLIPAYWSLWLSARIHQPQGQLTFADLLPLALYALAGTLVCELISSGGFYFFSGRFVDTNWIEFSDRLITYLPGNLKNQALYLGLAAIIHTLVSLLRHKLNRQQNLAT
ncbi:MAG: hypothetical protein P8163_12125 [Candidatus Thiodiazotropha sp.]